jgi:hypothetical protein
MLKTIINIVKVNLLQVRNINFRFFTESKDKSWH